MIVTKDPKSVTMTTELFGPVITAYVYDDADFAATCDLIDTTTTYALTGAVFCNDRAALVEAANRLRQSAGNFYINAPCVRKLSSLPDSSSSAHSPLLLSCRLAPLSVNVGPIRSPSDPFLALLTLR